MADYLADCTAIVITHNTKDLLRGCLGSLGGYPKIVVVDNASTDDTTHMLAAEFPAVEVIRNEANVGYGSAANLALKKAETPLAVLMNADTKVWGGALEAMTSFLVSNPEVAAVGPQLINSDGTIYPSRRRFPPLRQSIMHGLLGAVRPSNRWTRFYHYGDVSPDEAGPVDWVSGAFMGLRLDALREIGFFDEGYFMYVEDLDLCYWLRQKGWEVHYLPTAKVTHVIGASTERQAARMAVHHGRSAYRFFKKSSRGRPRRMLAPLVAAGLVARGGLVAVKALGTRLLGRR